MVRNVIWTPSTSLENLERQAITAACEFYKNKTLAANSLGIPLKTLEKKLALYTKHDEELKAQQNADKIKREEWNKKARGITHSYP